MKAINKVEKYRLTKSKLLKLRLNARMATTKEQGHNGAFLIPKKTGSLLCIISDGMGWEHVSVSIHKRDRCPTWDEMCFVKDLFWGDDETVVQYHPRQQDYISQHEYCLHLWKPTNVDLPAPSPILVGLQKGITH